ncbi:hypothetical protein D3C81_1283110 [compost metagenome]
MTWLASFALLNLFGHLLTRHCNRHRLLRQRLRVQYVLGYLLHYTLAAMVSLPLALYVSHFFEPSAARALALCLGYATSCGLIINSVVLSLIAAFDTGVRQWPSCALTCRARCSRSSFWWP